ncbi:MAG: antitoxin [Phycisphaerae bacterium]|nr:antitoxin [Gemmatimonadaceae bacterium]
MRTTVDIEPQLLKRLRDEAHKRGVPLKDFLNGVIRRGLDERVSNPPTRYRLPTFNMGNPVDGRSLDKALALAAELEDEEEIRKLNMRK